MNRDCLPHQQKKHSLRALCQLSAAAQLLRVRRVGLHDDERRVQVPERSTRLVKTGYRLKLHVRLRGCERGQADRLRRRAAHQKDRILSRLLHALSSRHSMIFYFMQPSCFCQSISPTERRDKENRYLFFPKWA